MDSGQITLHVRSPAGTRIEDTNQILAQVERQVRRIIPKNEIEVIVDNVGLNQSAINQIYNNSGVVGYQDADVFISLNKGHSPTADYVRTMREKLPRLFPLMTFSFPPPDITSQILNFGAPAPLDISVSGIKSDEDHGFRQAHAAGVKPIAGVADARIQQSNTFPQLKFNADRSRIARAV